MELVHIYFKICKIKTLQLLPISLHFFRCCCSFSSESGSGSTALALPIKHSKPLQTNIYVGRLKEKKPGDLTDDLRTALGMPVGPNAHKVPPPWLIAMQRYGPPPSYPNLKIPGLNAPIPDGCSFGYHAGGWGKPPVDEVGKPLYGDVFGTSDTRALNAAPTEEIDATLWGEMESESEEETDSEDEEEEEEGGDGGEETGLQTPVVGDGGMATPSGTTSTIGGQ